MRTSLRNLPRLCLRCILPGGDSPARLSPKRLAVVIFFLPAFVTLQLINRLCLLLDEVFFRRYRTVEIRQPLFVTGVPRSGTTLLHRLLVLNSDRVTTFTLWELIFAPSLTQRSVCSGIGKLDRLVGRPLEKLVRVIDHRGFGGLQIIHPTSLNAPEEDYLALTSILGCFLLVLPLPFYDELWYLSRFDDKATEAERDRLMTFYRRIVQRHLYWHGPDKRFVSKNPSFSAMVRCLKGEFPDAQFVCCLRSPEKVYPSLLNSMTEGAKFFGNDLQGDRYWQHLGEMLEYYYRHLVEEFDALPEDRGAYVTMETLVAQPAQTVRGLAERFEWDLSDRFAAALEDESRNSRRYRSRHHYSLEQFGLTPETLVEKYEDLYHRFDWRIDSESSTNDRNRAVS